MINQSKLCAVSCDLIGLCNSWYHTTQYISQQSWTENLFMYPENQTFFLAQHSWWVLSQDETHIILLLQGLCVGWFCLTYSTVSRILLFDTNEEKTCRINGKNFEGNIQEKQPTEVSEEQEWLSYHYKRLRKIQKTFLMKITRNTWERNSGKQLRGRHY